MARRKSNRKPMAALPFPEALPTAFGGGQPWDVVHSPGKACMSRIDRVMFSPSYETPEGRAVALHEMAHAFVSPKTPSVAMPEQLAQIAEDNAVTYYLAARFPVSTIMPATLKKKTVEMFKAAVGFYEKVVKREGPVPDVLVGSAATALACAFMLADMLKLSRVSCRAHLPKSIRDVDYLAHLTGDYRIPPDRRHQAALHLRSLCALHIRSLVTTLGPPGGSKVLSFDDLTTYRDGEWGEMIIDTPPLTITSPNIRKARMPRYRASDRGVIPMLMHRYVPDGFVFRVRRRPIVDRITIVMDISGSMSPPGGDDLLELLKTYPFATVALYCGDDGEGHLKIVAKDGKIAAPEHLYPYTCGNEIDLPALIWLAQQPGSRIWVSDQQVCSSLGVGPTTGRADCLAVCARAKIAILPRYEAVPGFLAQRFTPYTPPPNLAGKPNPFDALAAMGALGDALTEAPSAGV